MKRLFRHFLLCCVRVVSPPATKSSLSTNGKSNIFSSSTLYMVSWLFFCVQSSESPSAPAIQNIELMAHRSRFIEIENLRGQVFQRPRSKFKFAAYNGSRMLKRHMLLLLVWEGKTKEQKTKNKTNKQKGKSEGHVGSAGVQWCDLYAVLVVIKPPNDEDQKREQDLTDP